MKPKFVNFGILFNMKYTTERQMGILEALQAMSPDSSKNTLKSWLKEGRILLNDQPCQDANKLLESGDTLSLARKRKVLPLKIEVIYEDNDFVIIDKPQGLLSVATDTQLDRTAHAILKDHYNQRVYVVHRLDQDTSGVMVFALNKEALEKLKVKFAKHDIQRCYTAIVEGSMDGHKGTWQEYLLEDDQYHVRVNPEGELAITHWQIERAADKYSRLAVTLETGKKNQIRVHCAHAGHPVIGDSKYGAKTNPIKRLGLHAHLLAFKHPTSDKWMEFRSPIPESFEKLLPAR
jgi:tRNA pseudouridine32 synthase/23S rRNA pseudouridine746 synthase/23S rRNA pseudouridine1911/1915/1917 synthase